MTSNSYLGPDDCLAPTLHPFEIEIKTKMAKTHDYSQFQPLEWTINIDP